MMKSKLPVKLIALQSGIALGAVGVCVATALHSKSRLLQMGEKIGLPEHHAYFAFVNQQGAVLLHDLLIATSITSVLVLAAFVWLSSRMEGVQSQSQPPQGAGDSFEQSSLPPNVVKLKKVA